MLIARTSSPGETRELGAAVARAARAGDVVLLEGELGAGKTTFAQGFARGLGVPDTVTSPTFTLLRPYRCSVPGGLPESPREGAAATDDRVRVLWHADLYRMEEMREVWDLGLDELLEDGGVALVEWGDRAPLAFGGGYLVVRLEVPQCALQHGGAARPGSEERTVTFHAPPGGPWAERSDNLRDLIARWLGSRP
ncbi:MAG: tRNA (adenosine(37)-N6)-threonylcarbamoyltransferase complex ATPase subunit type 1 TsaE [Actinomycetota bacterium]|jgi:tRNA threonylcarbamoyladenosine biosynthesis protein TsaE|nr:tRNA (adenosine(37)-N6)-threonylcarbamoyltransferase complex ATPase subunit type 1 TsaE [Actinomycetota bacterium]